VRFGVIAAVFPVIFVGELPDKTMFASLVMASRGRARSVWLGAAAAFLVHVVVATTIGVGLFNLLPKRALDLIVMSLFLLGAAFAFREAARSESDVAATEAEVAAETAVVEEASVAHRRTVVTAFLVIFLAEWGDLTQILTANLAARYHSALSVGVGATLALWAVAGIAVVSGQGLVRRVPIRRLRQLTGVILLVLAIISFVEVL
jgi:putative Ca2+/H+ antiporter (TMEM165/GDT1 family)